MAVTTHASAGAFLAGAPAADCLILDYRMPEMDGLAMLDALAERQWRIPAILITAPVTEGILEAACRAGAFSVLEKPLSTSALVENIHRATQA